MSSSSSSSSSQTPNPTIMDYIGSEITGVMAPVSICMLIVVLLISLLSAPTSLNPSPPPITAATLVYLESPSDSPSQKIVGALLDAAVFVVLVTAVTFLLVLLYYYKFTNFLKNYMRFSAFFVLFSMGGGILLSLLQHFTISIDAITSVIILFNISAVGVLAVFSQAVPIIVRQGYMVMLAVIVAAWLSRLPEWTTWVLLIALAGYDLVAVLAPKGPLRILVELASSRDDDLPALVYESRPNIAPPAVAVAVAVNSIVTGSVEMQQMAGDVVSRERPGSRGPVMEMENLEEVLPASSTPDEGIAERSSSDHAVIEIERAEGETAPLVSRRTENNNDNREERGMGGSSSHLPAPEIEMFESSRGIKLGLGDFVFYSVLVGRAAMYDLMTVYACYLAIIAGLGCTLILLSVRRQALPALPISIVLGVGFYFLTRLLMEPFVVGTSTNLVMF